MINAVQENSDRRLEAEIGAARVADATKDDFGPFRPFPRLQVGNVLTHFTEVGDVVACDSLSGKNRQRNRHILQALYALLRGDHNFLKNGGTPCRVRRDQTGRGDGHGHRTENTAFRTQLGCLHLGLPVYIATRDLHPYGSNLLQNRSCFCSCQAARNATSTVQVAIGAA